MGLYGLVSVLLVCIPAVLGQFWGFGGCPKCWNNNDVHPMVLYCKATYALKIKPEKKEGNTFTAQVQKVYKGSCRQSRVTINTDCADYFELKKPYIILASGYDSGNEVVLNMRACDFKEIAKDFPCVQRTAFQYGYDCNCADMCVPPTKEYEASSQTRTDCFNKYVKCEKSQHYPYKCIRVFHHYYKPCLSSNGYGY
ncbi:uncharacterized protein [Argopecten irradians]|uniref:uncharacterized protein n=1 Tax=Argopecten irradians TaxID=31199 RepID=UPI00371865D1